MRRVVGKRTRTVYALSPRDEVGRGAEGTVYRRGSVCVKVFTDPLDEATVRKVAVLARRTEHGFAWPIEVVADESTGESVGFTSAFIPGETWEAVMERRETAAYSTLQKVEVALGVIEAAQSVHAARGPTVVMGDVIKAANVLVNGSLATFIDTASVSLSGVRAPDGSVVTAYSNLSTPGYTAPELLSKPGMVPTHAADRFSLSVLLCEVFYGRSPTEPRPSPAAVGFDPDQAVRDGLFFPFVKHPEHDPPTYDPVVIPDRLLDLLRSGLLSPPHLRPELREVHAALRHWKRDLTRPKAKKKPWKFPTIPDRVWKAKDRAASLLFLVAALLAAGRLGVSEYERGSLTRLLVAARLVDPPPPVQPPPLQPPPVQPPPAPVPPLPRSPVGPPVFNEVFR